MASATATRTTVICGRCRLPTGEPVGMELTGTPLVRGRGPRLVPTPLCRDCAVSLARWFEDQFISNEDLAPRRGRW